MESRSLVALIILGAIWGASFIFMRLAAPEFGVFTLVFIRVLLASIILWPFVLRAKGLRDVKTYWWPIFFVGVLNTAIPFALFNFASLYLQAGVNAILNATAPMFGALVAFIWLKDRLSKLAVVGFGLGFAGVVMISLHKTQVADISILPIAAAISATFCYGIAASFIKRNLSNCKPIALAAGSQIAASIVLVIPVFFDLPRTMPSITAWGSALTLAILGTGIAYILYFYLIAKTGPARAMTVGYLVPLFGILWGILVLGERLSLSVLLGGALILVGVMLTTGIFDKKNVLSTSSNQ